MVTLDAPAVAVGPGQLGLRLQVVLLVVAVQAHPQTLRAKQLGMQAAVAAARNRAQGQPVRVVKAVAVPVVSLLLVKMV